jgi:hypothetical protein
MEWFKKKLPGEKREGGSAVVVENPTTHEVVRAESLSEVPGELQENNIQWKEAA